MTAFFHMQLRKRNLNPTSHRVCPLALLSQLAFYLVPCPIQVPFNVPLSVSIIILARKLSPVRIADTVFEAFVQYERIDLHGRSWARWIGNILKFTMAYLPIHI